jgi:hypothetical protein
LAFRSPGRLVNPPAFIPRALPSARRFSPCPVRCHPERGRLSPTKLARRRRGPAVWFASVPLRFFYVVIPSRAVCRRLGGPAVSFASVPLSFFFTLSSRTAPCADALRDLLFLCQRISTQPNLLQPSIVFRSAVGATQVSPACKRWVRESTKRRISFRRIFRRAFTLVSNFGAGGAPLYITPEFADAEDLICGCRILCAFLFSKGCGF